MKEIGEHGRRGSGAAGSSQKRLVSPEGRKGGMRSPSHLCGFSPKEGPQELSQGEDRPDLKPQGGPWGLRKG